MQARLLREAIREFLQEEQMSKLTRASVLRDIADKTDSIFKYSSNRLTLVDKAQRPFEGMDKEEIETKLVSFIESAGYDVKEVISPGATGSQSSKFNTFIVSPKIESNNGAETAPTFDVVFGYSFSAAETDQFEDLDQAVRALVEENGGDPILVWDGEDYVSVDNVDRVGSSGGKADVVLRLGSVPAIKISLKNLRTGRASDMQQWGGLTKFMDHPEVSNFIDDVRAEIKSGFSGRMWRPIEDENLKMKAMWEDESGPVDVILAGTVPKLVPDGPGRYRIDVDIGTKGAGGAWHYRAGESPDDQFEPVMMVRQAPGDKGRKLADMPGVRGMIMPKGAITGPTKEI
jgi:hypothetical protein